MEIRFIGQGYNRTNSCVASELISSLENTNYTSFKCLVAFASYGGVSALTNHILSSKSHITEFNTIIGIDNKGTSKEALAELIQWGINVNIYHSLSKIIFHPKIYVFRGARYGQIIIGSNNLTEMGLSKNVEASVLIDAEFPHDAGIFEQIQDYFENLMNGTDNNIKSLTQSLLDDLVPSGKVPNEGDRVKSHDSKYGASSGSASSGISSIFSHTFINQNPPGFKPKRIVRRTGRPASGTTATTGTFSSDNENWIGEINNPVVVAEIGGGQRWKQVNFPISMFQDFFGATPGDSRYHINLRHVSSTSELGDVEDRQAVTVASQNYRFELGAATGAYPSGNRPIGVFIRVAEKNFLYHIVRPTDTIYHEVNTFLVRGYSGPRNNLNRITTDTGTLIRNCPNLPF